MESPLLPSVTRSSRGVPLKASLCESCCWVREVTTARSRFLLCELSKTDAAYPKYPRQPVVRCQGHQRQLEERPEEK